MNYKITKIGVKFKKKQVGAELMESTLISFSVSLASIPLITHKHNNFAEKQILLKKDKTNTMK